MVSVMGAADRMVPLAAVQAGLKDASMENCKLCGGSMQPGKAPYQIHEWSDPSAPGGVFRMGVLINRMKCEECGRIVDRDCGEGLAYSELYDARYVIATGQWIEEKCSDADCRYCKDRPETGG